MTRQLILKNDVGQLALLTEFMEEIGVLEEWDTELLMNLCLVLEEAVMNVISYAYGKETECEFDLTFTGDSNEVCFMLKDSGFAFNPILRESPDLTLPPEKRQIGGLGIVLIREIMDEVIYKRQDGYNILVMKKQLTIDQ